MTPAMWVIGVLAVVFWAITRECFIEAHGDNFGAGIMTVVCFLIALLLSIAWLVLATVHWWPR